MAKGQNLTPHQRGIVQRYYEHFDTVQVTRLQELVSDLFIAEKSGDAKTADKLWKKADEALARLKVEPARAARATQARDAAALARLVGELTAPGRRA